MSLEVSFGAHGAAYIQLNDGLINVSQEIDESTIVDVDEFGCVVGVEFLNLTKIPSADCIRKRAHVKECDVATLELYLQQLMRTSFTNSSLTSHSRVRASNPRVNQLESL
ncbi:DUF2283 domain-containing protein [Corynebacterium sp.]|uniref:DUF2283 domain-containing protein n=1 Tax=Corynebacterium sp. TaxID=1720 RepID=UPI0039C88392